MRRGEIVWSYEQNIKGRMKTTQTILKVALPVMAASLLLSGQGTAQIGLHDGSDTVYWTSFTR